jgi:hypothetical protein
MASTEVKDVDPGAAGPASSCPDTTDGSARQNNASAANGNLLKA